MFKYKKKYNELLKKIEQTITNKKYNDKEKYAIIRNLFYAEKITEILNTKD